MPQKNPFKYFKTSREIIKLAVMYYYRYALSLREVEDILHERGIDVTHESIRFWAQRFGKVFATDIRKKRKGKHSNWGWHLDEVFVKINGKLHYLWRAIDHEGEVLESVVTKRRNRAAALKLLRKLLKQYGEPGEIITDKLGSYGAALKELGMIDKQTTGRHVNNLIEVSHQPFRRQERGKRRFRSHKALQIFCSNHAVFYNHFNHQRHLNTRANFKNQRNATLAEWRQI